jgi:hypothetical protein
MYLSKRMISNDIAGSIRTGETLYEEATLLDGYYDHHRIGFTYELFSVWCLEPSGTAQAGDMLWSYILPFYTAR